MYEGAILDAFLHAPWIGSACEGRRADLVSWTGDPRLKRVMQTFHHETEGEGPRRYDLSTVLADMDVSGVERAILAAKVYYPTTEDRLRLLHEELAALCAASAGRLRWLATVLPPEHGQGSYWDLMRNPRILADLTGDPNLVGVHITPSPWGLAPNDRWYYPLYARCADLGLKLFTYVGMPGPLWPMQPNNPAHLEDIALAFPDLVIIAHHIGDPWTEMSVRLAARHDNVYICTSAWSPKSYPQALTEFMAKGWHGTRGSDKVLFASDYPLTDLRRITAAMRGMRLDEADLKRVLHDNSLRLLFS